MMKELVCRIRKKEAGYSLMELIIVITILVIIGAVAIPQLLENVAEANRGKDESNAKMIADAVITAVAQNPEYEGTEVTMQSFRGSAGAVKPSAGSEGQDFILYYAVNIIDGNVPVIASKDYGTVGKEFQVHMSDGGEVTVYNDDGSRRIFPDPELGD